MTYTYLTKDSDTIIGVYAICVPYLRTSFLKGSLEYLTIGAHTRTTPPV